MKSITENRKEVQEQLSWDSSVDTRNIRVEQSQGKIRLTGTVPSYAGRIHAFRDACNTVSGAEVVNQLIVSFPRGASLPPEEMLELNIADFMALVSWLDGSKIKVRVSRRLVYLNGETEYLWQKLKLERIIGELKGVAGIMNTIDVKPGIHLSDNRIARDIIASLDRIAGLDSANVGVNVVGGRVFLEGAVSDPLEAAAVERAVAYTRGVIDVINNLRSG